MKHTIHTPTEQFGFVETEFEENAVEATNLHEALVDRVKTKKEVAGIGIDKKRFDALLDEYILTGKITNGGDVYGDMNAEQQTIIQAIKRSRARTKDKMSEALDYPN